MFTLAKQPRSALPRPPRKTIFLALACATALAGCQPVAPSGGNQDEMYPGSFDRWARFNHLHNDADQKKATEAEQTFASPVGVLSDAVGQDLNALKAMQTTANAANEKLKDTILADLTTSMTWEGLRDTVLSDMGIDVTQYTSDSDRDADVTARIILRQEKVAAIAKVLALIADTQAALVDQGNQNAATVANDAEKGTSSTAAGSAADTTTLNRAHWAQTLFSTVVDAGQQFTDYKQSVASANAQQQKLLAALNNSKDPSSAFALVAVVGTGLDDRSFDLLNKYLQSLKCKLDHMPKPCPISTAAAPQNPADQSWQNVIYSFNEATKALKIGQAAIQSEAKFKPGPGADWQALLDFAQNSDVQNKVDVIRNEVGKLKMNSKGKLTDQEIRSAYHGLVVSRRARARAGATVAPQNAPAPQTSSAGGGLTVGQSSTTGAEKEKRLSTTALRLRARQQLRFAKLARFKNDLDERKKAEKTPQTQPASSPSIKPAPKTWRVKARNSPDTKGAGGSAELELTIRLLRYAIEQDLVDVSNHIDSAKATSSTASKTVRLVLPNLTAKKSKLSRLAVTRGKSPQPGGASSSSSNAAQTSACDPPAPAAPVKAGTSQSTGFSFLSSILAAQPSLLTTLQNQAANGLGSASNQIGLTDADLKFIGSVVSDIDSQAKNANQRVQAMAQDLLQIGADTNQENLRHTQTLSTIANLEVKRWLAMGSLDEDYSNVFDPDPDPIVSDKPETYPLFDESKSCGWAKLVPYQTGPKGTVSPDNNTFIHPSVKPDDKIYPTVIRLLQTARAWHTVTLNNNPDNYPLQLDVSDQRLYLAVRTIQGHLLMDSLNRKAADDDGVRLVYELALHQNQLDDLHARVEEAGLRLNLGNIRAYNETGITASDIQSIMQAADDVYLGLTVSKVNK